MAHWLTHEPSKELLKQNYKFETKVNFHFFNLFEAPIQNSNKFVKVEIGNMQSYEGTPKHPGSFADVEGGCFYHEDTGKGYLMLFNKWRNPYTINQSELEQKLGGTLSKCTALTPDKELNLTKALESETQFRQKTVDPVSGQYSCLPFAVYVFEFERN